MNINVLISADNLSIDNAYQSVLSSECGGNCLFIGTTRNVNKGEKVVHLNFETYEAMALKVMNAIGEEALDKFKINHILLHHRKGKVDIKDIAVIIAVSAPHRDAAFKACKYAIDELKDRVPIWKKEFLEDGSYWVNARP